MDREYFIKNSIMNLRHKRFKSEQEIISKISSYNDILNINLKKDYRMDSLDYLLVGDIKFGDIQCIKMEIWYLIDHYNNMYITETHIFD